LRAVSAALAFARPVIWRFSPVSAISSDQTLSGLNVPFVVSAPFSLNWGLLSISAEMRAGLRVPKAGVHSGSSWGAVC
jgi:hypothetical protein